MEDVGIKKSASQIKAVGANIKSISESELLAAFMGEESGLLKQVLMLSFSCVNLPNLDKESKSDCFAVLHFLRGKEQHKLKLGMTELIVDNLNPVWVQTIETDFFFEEQH